MKNIVVALTFVALVGCGAEAQDNRAALTDDQRADVAQRIAPYGEVQVAGQETAAVDNQQVAAAGDAGKAKYAVCAACHGAQGQGGVGPMLAGQDVDAIVSKLTAYRNKETLGAQSALMWGQAANLSDQDIQDLAEYVNTL